MQGNEIITEIFQKIEKLRKLAPGEKEALSYFMIQRQWMLEYKLSNSGYQPLSSIDHKRANVPYSKTLLDWIQQFPQESQLGALALGLSVHYITEKEFNNFLGSCASQINSINTEHIRRREQGWKIIPYALTDRTDIYGKLVHRIGSEGTSNADTKIPGPLESFIIQAAMTINHATGTQPLPYERFDLKPLIHSLLNKTYLIIEDWSLSGRTMGADISDFLHLLKVIFSTDKIRTAARSARFHLPELMVVLPFATEDALKRIKQILSQSDVGYSLRYHVITGFVFEADDRLAKGCTPDFIKNLSLCMPRIKWGSEAHNACEAFARIFTASSPEFAHGGKLDEEILKYGYGKKGWTIVGFHNCPDNSLPLYWKPFRMTSNKDFIPIFPRIISKVSHKGTGDEIRSMLDDTEQKQKILESKVIKVIKEIEREQG